MHRKYVPGVVALRDISGDAREMIDSESSVAAEKNIFWPRDSNGQL